MFDCLTANLMHLRLPDDQIPWPFLDHLDPFSTDFDSLQWSFQEPKLQVPTISYHIQPARPETACKVHQTWGFGTLKSFFFVAIPWRSFFYHFVLWKWSFFCFASPKNIGCNECLWVIFPRLPVEIGTVQPRNTCCNCTAFAVVFNMSLHILM